MDHKETVKRGTRCRCGVCGRFLSCEGGYECRCGNNIIEEGRYSVTPCEECYQEYLDWRFCNW